MTSYPARSKAFQFALILPLAVGIALLACSPGASPTAPAEPTTAPAGLIPATAWEVQPKADVCHLESNGSYHPANVAQSSVSAHLAHGDWLISEETCDNVDNDCDGLVDEDDVCAVPTACPCYGEGDLDAIAFSGAFCTNDPQGIGEVSIIDFVASSFVQNRLETGPDLTCTVFNSSTGFFDSQNGLSTEQWDACNDLVVARQQDPGVCL